MQKIRKGDKVVVLTGKDKGRTGEVIQVMPKEDRALVRGVNVVKRHQRQTQNQEAGIITKEASIHLSNIAIADPKDGKPTRVGFQVLPKEDRAVVRGVNMVKRHQRQTQSQEAGIINKEASIHLSNIAIADPQDGKPTRVGFKIDGDKKVRVAKRSGDVIDG